MLSSACLGGAGLLSCAMLPASVAIIMSTGRSLRLRMWCSLLDVRVDANAAGGQSLEVKEKAHSGIGRKAGLHPSCSNMLLLWFAGHNLGITMIGAR